tara:strand:+ start:1826 stop:2359 length:534 start_codon:yes stop_codon:yes gene_type:complete
MINLGATDFLVDTGVLSGLLDDTNRHHDRVKVWFDGLPDTCRKLVSVVAIAELRFGRELALVSSSLSSLPRLDQVVSLAGQFDMLEITHPTTLEYAQLKAKLAQSMMPKKIANRKKANWGNPEIWKSEFTGVALQIQENDLWQCAQAIEREIIFVTIDKGVSSVAEVTDGQLRHLVI